MKEDDLEGRKNASEGYLGVAPSDFQKMSDAELAQWPDNTSPSEARRMLAEREWQRRMISHQLTEQFSLDSRLAQGNERAMRFAAIIGVVGTLAGAGVGAFATFKTSSSQTPQQASQPQAQAELGTSKEQSTSAKGPASSASK